MSPLGPRPDYESSRLTPWVTHWAEVDRLRALVGELQAQAVRALAEVDKLKIALKAAQDGEDDADEATEYWKNLVMELRHDRS